MVEIDSGLPTQIAIGDMSVGTLDRMFDSFAKSSYANMDYEVSTLHDPMWHYTKGLSDHSPTSWGIIPHKPKPLVEPRLPDG